MLNSKKLWIGQLAKKFDYKILEPFDIDKVILQMAMKLKLLDQ
jgi:hypothetical protein